MDALSVTLSPLQGRIGIRTLLQYERAADIPWYRRFFAVLAAVLLLATALMGALWWLNQVGFLQRMPIVALFAIGYALLAAAGFVWFAIDLARRAKLALFAWANGWAYADTLEGTRRPGSAFARTISSKERGVVASDSEPWQFELGHNYSVATRSSNATIQRPFAFVELPLPVKVPHLVLKNRKRSIIPTFGLSRSSAKMELEGDFAQHFLLFAPEGYQQDALYIFTPDLMAKVLDLGAGAEIELVENRLYVYLPGSTRFDRPEVMTAVLTLAAEFTHRFARRTELYRDDKRDAVAERAGIAIGLRGQRLADSGVSVLGLAATGAALLLSCAFMTFGLFGGAILTWFGVG